MMRLVQHLWRILGILRVVPRYKAIIALQLLSGMLNFVGIPLLIPALEYINGRPVSDIAGPVQKWTEAVFSCFAVPLTPHLLLITLSALVIGGLLFNFLSSILANYMYLDIYNCCSKRLFQGYLDAEWSWLVKHHSGEISHALYIEASQWANTAFCALKVLTSLIQFATYFALAFYISLISTACVGIVFLLLMAGNILNARILKRYGLKRNEEQKGFAAFVNSAQQNKKFLKASLIHESIVTHYGQIVDAIVDFAKNMARCEQFQKLWTQSLVFLLLVLVLAFHKALHLGFEPLAVLLLVFMRLMPQLNVLTADYSTFSQSLPVYDSVQERLADLAAHREVYGEHPYQDGSSIRLENVSFSYNQRRTVLKDVSLDIPSRSTVAIVGESGSGKSSTLDLILGLWQPSSGRLMYGNQSHQDIDYRTLRRRTAYVGQETTLFNGSLRENLTMGNPAVSQEKLKEVCRAVFLDGVISELPHGLDTEIGENGIQLSGGQRQRVALGRALLIEPSILILDEATSSLDLESEQIIQRAVNALHQNLTILVVTHRLSTVKDADLIYVLEDGRISEQGNFQELMGQKGRFSSLYSIQLSEVLAEKAAAPKTT